MIERLPAASKPWFNPLSCRPGTAFGPAGVPTGETDRVGRVIDVSDVSKGFGGLMAVNRCSLNIRAGSITGLIGPNGAGKTTLFNIIAGRLKPDAGTIRLDGADITGLPPHQLFHKGVVRTFQIPHEFTRMTVRENLMVPPPGQLGESLLQAWFGRRAVRSQDDGLRRRADEVLAFLKLDHLADAPAGTLSGGQKKLLELGRTMMTTPRVVLLDEPAAGVNRTLLASLIESIEVLNRKHGYTFCIIEHDMDLVARLCDPVIVMVQGSVMAQGSVEDVRHNAEVREAYLGGGMSGRLEASR